jgi:hypothetical protein
MKNKKISLILLVGLLSFLCISTTHVAALDTTFSQSIRPLDCTVSNIQTGIISSTEYSLACGPVVVPGAPYPRGPRNATVYFPAQWWHSGSSGPYLNDIPTVYNPGGLTLLLEKGDVYTFRVEGDTTPFVPRTFELFQKTVTGIELQFSSYQSTIYLPAGEGKKIDLSGDGVPDVMLRLEGFQSSGVALMRFGLLTKPSGVIEEHKALLAVMAIGAIFGVTGMHFYHRRRLPPLEDHWRAPHKYHRS